MNLKSQWRKVLLVEPNDEPFRRDDDYPDSPANAKLLERLGLVEARIQEFTRQEPKMVGEAVRTAVEEHEKSSHTLIENINGHLLDVIEGPAKVDPVTGEPLVDGAGHVLRDKRKGLRYQLSNGGIPAKVNIPWSKVILVVAGQVGVIISAMLTLLK